MINIFSSFVVVLFLLTGTSSALSQAEKSGVTIQTEQSQDNYKYTLTFTAADQGQILTLKKKLLGLKGINSVEENNSQSLVIKSKLDNISIIRGILLEYGYEIK